MTTSRRLQLENARVRDRLERGDPTVPTSSSRSTAFSPTDTMPLTHTAKIVMAIQSFTALRSVS